MFDLIDNDYNVKQKQIFKNLLLKYCFVLILSLLFSTVSYSTELKALSSSEECTTRNIPYENISMPFPVMSGTTYRSTAKRVLDEMRNANDTFLEIKHDSFHDEVYVYSRVIRFSEDRDDRYPEYGCRRSATLKSVCEKDFKNKSQKCGLLCQFDKHCVDHR